MSYILDALRRADAERARGQIPGLHDQPSLQRQGGSTPRGRLWLWGVAAVALLSVAGGMAWWWARPGTAPPAAVALATAPAVIVQAAPTPAAAAPAAASAPLPSSDPTAPPAVATARQVSLPQVVSAPEPVAAEPAASRKAASAAAAAPTARSSVAAVAEGPRVVKLTELSADQRRDLPPLVLGGRYGPRALAAVSSSSTACCCTKVKPPRQVSRWSALVPRAWCWPGAACAWKCRCSRSGRHHRHTVLGQRQGQRLADLPAARQVGRDDEDLSQFGGHRQLVEAAQVGALEQGAGQRALA